MGNKHSMVKELAAVADDSRRVPQYESSVLSSSAPSSTASGPYERIRNKKRTGRHGNDEATPKTDALDIPADAKSDETPSSSDEGHLEQGRRQSQLLSIDTVDGHDADVESNETDSPVFVEKKQEAALQSLHSLIAKLDEYELRTPKFYKGTLSKAVEDISHEGTVEQPILIYLHHGNSTNCEEFEKEVLCTDNLLDFVENNFLFWGWDMTGSDSRQAFYNMAESHIDSETITRVLTFGHGDYPVFVLLLKSSSKVSISQVVEGYRSLDEVIAILMTAQEVFSQMLKNATQPQNANVCKSKLWGASSPRSRAGSPAVSRRTPIHSPVMPRSSKQEPTCSTSPPRDAPREQPVAHVMPFQNHTQIAKPNPYEFTDIVVKNKDSTTFEETMLVELQDGVETEVTQLRATLAQKDKKIRELEERMKLQHIYENIPVDNPDRNYVPTQQNISGDWSD